MQFFIFHVINAPVEGVVFGISYRFYGLKNYNDAPPSQGEISLTIYTVVSTQTDRRTKILYQYRDVGMVYLKKYSRLRLGQVPRAELLEYMLRQGFTDRMSFLSTNHQRPGTEGVEQK